MPEATPKFQVGDIVRFNLETRLLFPNASVAWLQQEPLVVRRVLTDGLLVARLDGKKFTHRTWDHTDEVRFNADRFELHPFLDSARKAIRDA